MMKSANNCMPEKKAIMPLNCRQSECLVILSLGRKRSRIGLDDSSDKRFAMFKSKVSESRCRCKELYRTLCFVGRDFLTIC